MKNKWKKTMAGLLTMAFAAGFVPANPYTSGLLVSAYADSGFTKSEANTTLGTLEIGAPNSNTENTAWTGNYVYYGKYDGTNGTKYRVLAPNTTAYGVTGGSMLLDCDTVLYKSKFGSNKQWTSSTVKTGLNGDEFLNKGGVFTSLEKKAIAESKKEAGANVAGNTVFGYDGVALNGEQVFLLEAAEVNNTYGYSNSKTRVKSNVSWWLRSPQGGSSSNLQTAYVKTYGALDSQSSVTITGVSPAFNVDLNNVLFTTKVNDNSGDYGNEYKLTLKDENFGIAVTSDKSATVSGSTITVPYTVTDTDDALDPDTVSVLIKKNASDEILYYAPLTGTYASESTGTFELPSTLTLDDWGTDYTVSILAEEVNGQYETDYASDPVTLSAPEKENKSADLVASLGSNYYYTYGTLKTGDKADNDKVYIIYVYDGDLKDADYIAVKGTKDNVIQELDTSKRIDTVYKSIKFPDESILNADDLTNATGKYFVAIVLNNENRFVPDTNKFLFVPEKNASND